MDAVGAGAGGVQEGDVLARHARAHEEVRALVVLHDAGQHLLGDALTSPSSTASGQLCFMTWMASSQISEA